MTDFLNATWQTIHEMGQAIAVSPWSVMVLVVLFFIAWRVTSV